MRTAAVIIAGGKSRRMGGERKLFVSVGGRPIVDRIIAILSLQAEVLALNANDDPSFFSATGLAVIPDLLTGVGTPLAGLHAALRWGQEQGVDCVLTVPSDTPFLPRDLVQRLASARSDAAISGSRGQSHFLTGLWAIDLLPRLEHALAVKRLFRVKDWAAEANATVITWEESAFDPFFNVNTPEELAEAERIAAESDP
jgi:molybdenum cofactor guanylyltransferase